MAEVAKPTSLTLQVSLVALVRWQSFCNGLRSRSEKMHLLGSVALGLFIAALVFGVSVGICVASYAIVESRSWLLLSLLLWGIFLFWQVMPVLASEMNPGFDGRNLLRFPLRFSAFFLMSAMYGVADPFAFAGILWHIAIGVGVSIARPDLAGWAALALILSIKMNVLFNRLVFAWLERVLAKRRMREIAGVLIVLLFVALQFSGYFLRRWGPVVEQAVERSAWVWRACPPAVAGTVIEDAADGNPAAALQNVGLLAVYALVFGGLYAVRVRAQFTGEDLGESSAPMRQKPQAVKRVPVSPPAAAIAAGHASSLPRGAPGIVRAPVAAIFAKEFRYFYRNTMMMMNVFMPLVLILFFSLTPAMPGRRGGASVFGRFGGDFAYPASIIYILLLMMNFCPNNLAYEGRGVERLFLAPINFSDVMLGKNLFHGALLAFEAIIALILVSAAGHPPSPVVLLATWAALLFAALLHLAVGNWVSIQFPRRFEFGVRRQRPSGLSMIISFGLFFAVTGTVAGAAALCIWLVGLWLLPFVYLALGAAALVIYRLILDETTRQAIRQRDTMLEQLSR